MLKKSQVTVPGERFSDERKPKRKVASLAQDLRNFYLTRPNEYGDKTLSRSPISHLDGGAPHQGCRVSGGSANGHIQHKKFIEAARDLVCGESEERILTISKSVD